MLDLDIHSVSRTRVYQDVESTTISVFERLKKDKTFASLLKLYGSFSPHYRDKKPLVIDWEKSLTSLLDNLSGDTRFLFSFIDRLSNTDIGLQIELNCSSNIEKEKINGKLRDVPTPSDLLMISISAKARFFTDLAFTQAYLFLASDMFEIIDGEYGWAQYQAIQNGNDFDQHWYQNHLVEPWFITWANFFGLPWVKRLGRERLLRAPAYQVRELPKGSILLTVTASPLDQLNPEVQERISRVKSYLGILTPSERATPEELFAFEEQRKISFEEIQLRITQVFQEAKEKTVGEMLRQAEGCVQGARKFFGVTLDFTPKSLKVIDNIILNNFDRNEDDETIETGIQAFGSYVGEVVRRNLGGDWHDEEMNGQPFLLNVGQKQVRVDPFEAVRLRFEAIGNQTDFELMNWFTSIYSSHK